jgi:hypothetical protein
MVHEETEQQHVANVFHASNEAVLTKELGFKTRDYCYSAKSKVREGEPRASSYFSVFRDVFRAGRCCNRVVVIHPVRGLVNSGL